jgi:hypothetical protein
MRRLYSPHPRSLTVLYSEVEEHAFAQGESFVGTAGSLTPKS